MHFGSRTYTIEQLDLRHLWEANVNTTDDQYFVRYGIGMSHCVRHGKNSKDAFSDLTEYYPSVEWNILDIPAHRRNKTYKYGEHESTYSDITYEITLRRLPLFYTVNIIFPVVGISFLTIFVFYLPSDSGEKISLSISILVSLTVFFMLLTEIIPATSDVLPMIGKAPWGYHPSPVTRTRLFRQVPTFRYVYGQRFRSGQRDSLERPFPHPVDP